MRAAYSGDRRGTARAAGPYRRDKNNWLAVAAAARANEMPVMVGCMLGTSLAMAPAMLIAAGAAFVDLDGPLLLAKDRDPGLHFEGSTVHSYGPEVWG